MCAKEKQHYARGYCKFCYARSPEEKKRRIEYKKRNKDKVRLWTNNYYRRHADEIKAKRKQWREKASEEGYWGEKLFLKANKVLSDDVAMAFTFGDELLDEEMRKRNII